MASSTQPAEPPPPYSEASNSQPSTSHQQQSSSHLQVPQPHRTRNGIPPQERRSMEDESRSLPDGWVRQYDSQTHHQFYVDTTASPPRSIWHHPHDDETFLASVSPQERERIANLHEVPSRADIEAESSDDDTEHRQSSSSYAAAELPPRSNDNAGDKPKGVSGFSRKLKDKLTSSTHTEREASRRQRAEQEAIAYERHQHIRRQMSRAMETGQPQLLGKDKQGKDVYIEPPTMAGMGMGMGMGGMRGYGGNGYGYNPYVQGPYHHDPSARYLRPQGPYGRPYGRGYGGGMGLPLALGGLGGGMMLGGLLF